MMVERMASELGVSASFIANFSRGASHAYKEYSIPKIGGLRPIEHPSKQLKGMQRWLLAYVVMDWPVHPAAMAYRKGISTFQNARIHASNKFLLKMDFTDFFRSITQADLQGYIQANSGYFDGWTADDGQIFRDLICRHARLTIGAPTPRRLATPFVMTWIAHCRCSAPNGT